MGLICSAFSGSPAEAWMSSTYLESNPDYYRQIIVPYQQNYERYLHAKEAYDKEAARRAAAGLPPPTTPPPDPPFQPGELYNGMIAPLLPLAIRGVAWYQGEANVSRAWQYRSLFPDLITTWRTAWRQATSNPELTTMPFLAVQLAPFLAIQEMPAESAWAELREAQVLATRLPKVGLAIITDCGDPARIHPRKKEPVGMRLALAARSIAYNQPVVGTSPMFRSLTLLGPRAVLAFDGVGGGLQWRGAATAGFAICGEDRRFVWATTVELQTNNTIVVSHPAVPNPVAVRYGWADYPTGTLWSSNGLPASPFRTDTFPLTTEPASDLAPIAGLGTALTFDGEGHVEIGQPPFAGTNADFTIELWAKTPCSTTASFTASSVAKRQRAPSAWTVAHRRSGWHPPMDHCTTTPLHAPADTPAAISPASFRASIHGCISRGSRKARRIASTAMATSWARGPPRRSATSIPAATTSAGPPKASGKAPSMLVRVWCAARTPEQVRDDMYVIWSATKRA